MNNDLLKHKIQKYESRINNSTSVDKQRIYNEKIGQYKTMLQSGGSLLDNLKTAVETVTTNVKGDFTASEASITNINTQVTQLSSEIQKIKDDIAELEKKLRAVPNINIGQLEASLGQAETAITGINTLLSAPVVSTSASSALPATGASVAVGGGSDFLKNLLSF